MTTETNLPVTHDSALQAAADRLLAAAMDYHKEYTRVTGGAAVVWVKDSHGGLVILTRGEYRAQLLTNIDRLQNDVDDGGALLRFEVTA